MDIAEPTGDLLLVRFFPWEVWELSESPFGHARR